MLDARAAALYIRWRSFPSVPRMTRLPVVLGAVKRLGVFLKRVTVYVDSLTGSPILCLSPSLLPTARIICSPLIQSSQPSRPTATNGHTSETARKAGLDKQEQYNRASTAPLGSCSCLHRSFSENLQDARARHRNQEPDQNIFQQSQHS